MRQELRDQMKIVAMILGAITLVIALWAIYKMFL